MNLNLVFMVEDDFIILESLKIELNKYFNVITANNGLDAIDKLIKNNIVPDIIVSDIIMDKMDGIGLYNYIMKNEKFKHIPFLFLTSKNDIKDKIWGLNIGAIDYITKPFYEEELIYKIQNILNNKREYKRFIFENQIETNKNKYLRFFSQHNLSDKEIEISTLLLSGFKNKEISFFLSKSLKTVETHITNIYKKFNVKNKNDFYNSMT